MNELVEKNRKVFCDVLTGVLLSPAFFNHGLRVAERNDLCVPEPVILAAD